MSVLCNVSLILSNQTCENVKINGTRWDWKERTCSYNGLQGLPKAINGELLTSIALFGIMLNIINLWIFNTIYKQQLILRLIMLALSASDLLEVINYMTFYSFTFLFPESEFVTGFLTDNLEWLTVARQMTMTFNRWLLVLMTGERFYVILKASRGTVFQQSQRKIYKGLAMILGLALASFVINLPRYWEFSARPCMDSGKNDTHRRELFSSKLACQDGYLWFYSTIFIILINTLLPCFLIFSFNTYIVYKMTLGRKNTHRHGGDGIKNKIKKATRMCVLVSFIFLFLQIPYIAVTIQKSLDRIRLCQLQACEEEICMNRSCPLDFLRSRNASITASTIAVANEKCGPEDVKCFCYRFFEGNKERKSEDMGFWTYLGLILNCSINFFIYIAMSDTFRKVFMKPFHRFTSTSLETSNSKRSGRSSSTTSGGVRAPGLTNFKMSILKKSTSVKSDSEAVLDKNEVRNLDNDKLSTINEVSQSSRMG